MARIKFKYLLTAVSALMTVAPNVSRAQINGAEIGASFGSALGEAVKSMAEAIMKRNNDMMARRLVFNSDENKISNGDTVISITLKNPHYDTANFSVKLFSSPQPPLINPVSKTEKGGIATRPQAGANRPKRSIVANDDQKDSTVINYKDLTSWVSADLKDFKIAPGESKTFQVKIKAPGDLSAGIYATWVTAIVLIGPNTFMRTTTDEEKQAHDIKGESTALKLKGMNDPNRIPEGAQILSFSKIILEKK